MLTKIFRTASSLVHINTTTKLTKISTPTSSNTRFCFSQNNKNQNNLENDGKPFDQIDNQPLKDKKEDTEDGFEPSKFGNSMLFGSALALLIAYVYMQVQVIRANKQKKKDISLIKQVASGKAQIGG